MGLLPTLLSAGGFADFSLTMVMVSALAIWLAAASVET